MVNFVAEPKNRRINLRASAYEELVLRSAAAAENISLSSFILRTAMEKARDILPQSTVITLSDDDYAQFLRALEAPVKQEKLTRLFAREDVFERPIEMSA